MSRNSFKEIFYSSWLNLVGIIFGIIGCTVIFWNEVFKLNCNIFIFFNIFVMYIHQGRHVQISITLQEAFRSAVSIKHDALIEKHLENQLIHVVGPLKIDEPLTEVDYNIMVQAVKLKRRVEMYQWIEGNLLLRSNFRILFMNLT